MYFLKGLTKEEFPYKTALQLEWDVTDIVYDEPDIQRTSELLNKIHPSTVNLSHKQFTVLGWILLNNSDFLWITGSPVVAAAVKLDIWAQQVDQRSVIVWTWSNFILPGSKPACEVRSCHLVTLLYTSHLHTSNLYDNRSLIVTITPGVGWELFDRLSIPSSLYYCASCASCIPIIFSPYVNIFR